MLMFSEALEQYLDARDKLAELQYQDFDLADEERDNARQAMTEAAARMDELMPGKS